MVSSQQGYTGFRIQERLRREVSFVVTKYKNAKGSRKKRELNVKCTHPPDWLMN